ncbi:MAG: hypothetical protein J4G13_11490 [Dehalococcoidia bacterium]|nr:hypothetical protein [Dehalococcoidia bacterium]
MVTASKNETAPAIAANAAPATTPEAPVVPVDVSAIPETPAELLRQWDTPRRPLARGVLSATLVRAWNLLAGPSMTQRDRLNREIAEAKGFTNGYMKLA